ncbi:MAG: hypothetical protein J6V09_05460 [Clostridia bacterium]|nr:hypothetical protein [Clostridia bacterium]
MKKTTKRFSLGMKIASILTCLVVTAVGFASWLVIKPADAATESGSFTVYKVETQGVRISVTSTASDIIFGKKTATYDYPWLVAKDVADEALTATFSVTVTTDNDDILLNSVASEIKVTFDIAEAMSTKFDQAITDTYLAAPTVTVSGGATGTGTYAVKTGDVGGFASVSFDAPAAKEVTFTVTVVFGWGAYTQYANPYEHFNALENTHENNTKAVNVLGAVYGITGETGKTDSVFTLKVETVVNE